MFRNLTSGVQSNGSNFKNIDFYLTLTEKLFSVHISVDMQSVFFLP
jgi:hypothetical protein